MNAEARRDPAALLNDADIAEAWFRRMGRRRRLRKMFEMVLNTAYIDDAERMLDDIFESLNLKGIC